MCKAYKNQPRILNKQHSKLILIYDKPLSRCSKIFYYIKIFLNTYLSEKHFRHKHHRAAENGDRKQSPSSPCRYHSEKQRKHT